MKQPNHSPHSRGLVTYRILKLLVGGYVVLSVLTLVAAGNTNREAAAGLFITEATVKSRRWIRSA